MTSASSFSILGWIPLKPIGIYGFPDIGIQMEQQILHKFKVGWEFIFTVVMVLQLKALGVPEPTIGVEESSEEDIKHLWYFYVLVCEVTVLIK